MSYSLLTLANRGVQSLKPYQTGKPVEELERELGLTNIIKLASNENPHGLAESAKQVIQQRLKQLTFYPDANGFYLKQAIAKRFSVNSKQITLGNGSNDLLEIIARAFVNEGSEVIFSQYSFIVYHLVTQALAAKSVVVPARDWGNDLPAILQQINEHTRLIFIANPNNPTGTFLQTAELESFLKQVPTNVIVVLDEAYTEYTPKEQRSPSFDWIARFPNLIVCRTFSKAYGLAGLRIGYTVSQPELAELFNRLRQPFNCNSLALLAAEAVLNDDAYLARTVETNNQGMSMLLEYCKHNALHYIPSMGNFLTIDFNRPALPIYDALLKKGIIVRPLMGYGMVNHLRISIGLPAEMKRLMQALTELAIAKTASAVL